ncbi:MAG: germination protein Ger(x)C family [Sporomusa sp.]|nr:germination protein Ger(x)C family [Sporomusa sp.]
MRFAVMILLITCILTTGCSNNGARETDEIAWVISIGIDRADDGDLLVTYRIAVPAAQAAGSENGSGGKDTSTLITIKAPTLAEARNLLNASMSRGVNLSQVTAIVIGEDLARHGIEDLIGPLLRFREFRGTIFIIVCTGKALDIFEANKPPLESLVSRWIHNSMRNYDETSYFISFNLQEFYTRLKSNSGAPLAVGYGLNPLSGQDQAADIQPGGKTKTYLPGDVPRQGSNATEFMGTAVFKEDKMVGFLDTGETRALSILLNTFSYGFLSVPDPLATKHLVTMSIRNGRAPKIDIDISGEEPVINVDVLLEGEISGLPTGIAYESKEYLNLLETQVSNTLQQQIVDMLARTQAWGTDVVDFGYFIRPKFMTIDEIKSYNWDRRFSQATFTVKVSTELRRTGLMRKTQPIRREAKD